MTTRNLTGDKHKTTRQRDTLTAYSPQDRTHPWRQFRCSGSTLARSGPRNQNYRAHITV